MHNVLAAPVIREKSGQRGGGKNSRRDSGEIKERDMNEEAVYARRKGIPVSLKPTDSSAFAFKLSSPLFFLTASSQAVVSHQAQRAIFFPSSAGTNCDHSVTFTMCASLSAVDCRRLDYWQKKK